MTIGYINLSAQAAAAEQRGDFAEAAKLWAAANAQAKGKNVFWSERRNEFCCQADKRTRISSREAFPYERAI